MTALSASFSDNEKNVLIELFSDNAGSREPWEGDNWKSRERGSVGDEARLEDLFPDGGTEGEAPGASESEIMIWGREFTSSLPMPSVTGEPNVAEEFVIVLTHFLLRYSRALRGITTGFDDIDCLEKRGVDAGPNGEDDIQLSFGFRDTEGFGEVDGREALGEYVCGIWAGRRVVNGKEDVRLWLNGAWVGSGTTGSSLACRRNRPKVGIALVLLTGAVVRACEENEDELAEIELA